VSLSARTAGVREGGSSDFITPATPPKGVRACIFIPTPIPPLPAPAAVALITGTAEYWVGDERVGVGRQQHLLIEGVREGEGGS
jgi:hypothetical protein